MTYPNNRLFCLDLLRGLDIFYLTVVTIALDPLLKYFQVSADTQSFFCGHPWYGFTLYDLIMPLFIFMAGAAVPFALNKRMVDGKPTLAYWKHVLTRFVFLWILGMYCQGALSSYNIHKISLYSNTLQTIALGYLVAAVIYPLKNLWVKALVPITLLVVYGLLIHFNGGYTKDANLSQRIDIAVFSKILPADNPSVPYSEKYGYVWLLPSMMFPVFALAGCYATQVLRSTWNEWKKARELAIAGVAAYLVGLILECVGVKCCKHIFSVSFTLQAIGVSTLLLTGLYVVTDIWKFRKGMSLFVMFGQFALTAYLCETILRPVVSVTADLFIRGLHQYLPDMDNNLRQALNMFEAGLVSIFIVWCRSQMKRKA